MCSIKKTFRLYRLVFQQKTTLLLLLIFLFTFFTSHETQAKKRKNAVRKRIERILKNDELADACIGIKIVNVNKNKVLFDYNSEKLFTPASTLKLLTTSAALAFLPENASFETKILSNGVIVDSVLLGDLIFRAGGDPLFSYEELDSLLTEFVKLGVKEIRGNIIGDVAWSDSAWFGKGWMWDDNPEPFMPYLSPLTLEEARVRVIVSPSAPYSLARVEIYPPAPSIKVVNEVLTVADDTTYFTVNRNWRNNDNTIFVEGFIAPDSEPDTTFLNVFAPERVFLEAAKLTLEQKSVKTAGKTFVKRRVPYIKEFFTFERKIDSVIFKTNKESDNFCAEMLLRKLGEELYGKPATAKKGVAAIDSLIALAGGEPEKYEIVDGSGISRYNLLSPALLVEILNFLRTEKPEVFAGLVETLPVMGVDGTLEERHRKGRVFGNVRAKTGTMTAVSALAGLTVNRSGDTLLFSIMMQNFSTSVSRARLFQDIICEIISNSR